MLVWAIRLYPCRYLSYNFGRKWETQIFSKLNSYPSILLEAQPTPLTEEMKDRPQDYSAPHCYQHGREAEVVLVDRIDLKIRSQSKPGQKCTQDA
jgi:hypothetical protein